MAYEDPEHCPLCGEAFHGDSSCDPRQRLEDEVEEVEEDEDDPEAECDCRQYENTGKCEHLIEDRCDRCDRRTAPEDLRMMGGGMHCQSCIEDLGDEYEAMRHAAEAGEWA